MFQRLRFACIVLLVTAIVAFGQTTEKNRYVIPRITSTLGSELILSNLSGRLATAEVTLLDSNTQQIADVFVDIVGGTQVRLTTANLGLTSFTGTAVITSAVPLSVMATLANQSGFVESAGPATNSTNLIVPFGPGTSGNMKVTLFNGDANQGIAVIAAMTSAGSTVGAVQRILPGLGTFSESVAEMFPQPVFSFPRDVSHLVIRTPTNVFGTERKIYAQAILGDFSAAAEGVVRPRNDSIIVNGVPANSTSLNTTIPFFVQGADYFTLVQAINTTDTPSSVLLTARDPDGKHITGNNPTVVQLPANGSFRKSVQNIFSFSTDTMTVGSITLQSVTPIVVTAAIGSVSQSSLVVSSNAGAPDRNFAFTTRQVDRQFFSGFTFMNPGGTTADLTLRLLLDDGTAVSRTTLPVPAFSSVTRSLAELLPEAQTNGFIHISSNVPILATGLEGRVDNTVFANLPVMYSQPDYVPPDPTKFVVSGTILHLEKPFPKLTIQLTGPVNASIATDQTGAFTFQNLPAGNYTLRPAAAGFSFDPPLRDVPITDKSERDANFSATLTKPTISVVQPASVVAGGPDTKIFVTGGPFISTSQILFEGLPVTTTITTTAVAVTIVGATGGVSVVMQNVQALQGTLEAQKLVAPRETFLQIVNSGPGGGVSSDVKAITVGTPAPVLTALGETPALLTAGNPGFSTVIAGTGFLPGVKVRVNGVERPTTLETPTTVRVTIPPEDLAEAKFLKLTAINPAPTVGESNPLSLPVLNPAPSVLQLSPSAAEVRLETNALPLAITVTGLGFKQGAKIKVGLVEVPTTFAGLSSLVGLVPASELQTGGVKSVTVANPAPAVAESEALPLFLSNLPPVLDSVDAGRLTFDPDPDANRKTESYQAPVILNGSNFGPSPPTVFEFATPCAGTASLGAGSAQRVSSHQAIMTMTIACAGTYSIRVRTVQPGGGISQVRTFTVVSQGPPAAPRITALSPPLVAAGSAAFTLTITGTNFEGGAVVTFGNTVLFPTALTATSITVNVPAYLVAQPQVVPVVVTNPSATGASNRVLFSVN